MAAMSSRFFCKSGHELGEATEEVHYNCSECQQPIAAMLPCGRCGECRYYMCATCAMKRPA
eukprot:7273495-Karenia_brevis.AAC.1